MHLAQKQTVLRCSAFRGRPYVRNGSVHMQGCTQLSFLGVHLKFEIWRFYYRLYRIERFAFFFSLDGALFYLVFSADPI